MVEEEEDGRRVQTSMEARLTTSWWRRKMELATPLLRLASARDDGRREISLRGGLEVWFSRGDAGGGAGKRGRWCEEKQIRGRCGVDRCRQSHHRGWKHMNADWAAAAGTIVEELDGGGVLALIRPMPVAAPSAVPVAGPWREDSAGTGADARWKMLLVANGGLEACLPKAAGCTWGRCMWPARK